MTTLRQIHDDPTYLGWPVDDGDVARFTATVEVMMAQGTPESEAIDLLFGDGDWGMRADALVRFGKGREVDTMSVYAITGPGELFLDEWLASNSRVTLVEATPTGLEEIRRLIAEQGAAVEIAPADPGYYPDDTEGGVVVHEDGTWTASGVVVYEDGTWIATGEGEGR